MGRAFRWRAQQGAKAAGGWQILERARRSVSLEPDGLGGVGDMVGMQTCLKMGSVQIQSGYDEVFRVGVNLAWLVPLWEEGRHRRMSRAD